MPKTEKLQKVFSCILKSKNKTIYIIIQYFHDDIMGMISKNYILSIPFLLFRDFLDRFLLLEATLFCPMSLTEEPER